MPGNAAYGRLATLVIILLSGWWPAAAQPGWRNMTRRYDYQVLDEKGSPIAFRNNNAYSMVVNGVRYTAPHIPADSLAWHGERSFRQGLSCEVRINDFSLAVAGSPGELDIQIIHGNDTMFLNQSTGMGRFLIRAGQVSASVNQPASHDRTLMFLGGHYYFPSWADQLRDGLPQAGGRVQFVNIDQRHFIIPASLYDSLARQQSAFERQPVRERAEQLVARHFTDNFLHVTCRREPTTITPSVWPFRNPRLYGPLQPTSHPEVYLGMTNYSWDTLQCSGSKTVFSLFNKAANTLVHWLPPGAGPLSGSGELYIDSFNQVIYQTVWRKQSPAPPRSACAEGRVIEQVFRSADEGKSWKKDPLLTQLYFKQYRLSQLNFLDKDFALAYARRRIPHKTRAYNIDQGIYYLLRNLQVVDSFRTPQDINYNDNYNHYAFSRKGDSVFLGSWTYDEYSNYGSAYFQPVLLKTKGRWNFQVMRRTFTRPVPIPPKDSTRLFRNFQVLHNRELVFLNGAGTLGLQSDIADRTDDHGVVILEKDRCIYLLDRQHGLTYLSFNGGASWYVYPLPLDESRGYRLLEVDDRQELSFFNGGQLHKVFYRFSPVNP
jgi:hypothetical protein